MNIKNKFFHEKIPELRKLKKIFQSLKYKGVDLWPNLMENVYVTYNNEALSSHKFLRILKFLFFFEKFKVPKKEKNKILVNFPLDRTDHHELFTNFIKSFNKKEITIINAYQSGERKLRNIANRFTLSFPNLVKILKIHEHLKKHKTKRILKKPIDYIYLVLFTYYILKKIDYWTEIYKKLKPRAFLGYASYRNNEDITLTQICKKHKIPTFTTQHYAFFDYPTFNSESITYENMISDYILLWGKAPFNIMKKFIPQDKLLIAGNPLYKKIKKSNKKFAPKTCVVFLDYYQYAKSNFEIIKILAEFAEKHKEIKFIIKNHPVNNPKEYEPLVKNTKLILLPRYADKDEWMQKADFIISHNTTIVLEALKFQIPIFRYKDKTCFEMSVPKHEFRNAKELESIFSKIKSNKNYASEYHKAYHHNFFQPEKSSIPDLYKKLITEKSN